MLGNDLQVSHDRGQIAIAAPLEAKRNQALTRLFDLGDILVDDGPHGIGFFLLFERKNYVLWRDRHPVLKSRSRVEPKCYRRVVIWIRYPLSDQAVGRGGLVKTRSHETVVQEVEAGRGQPLECKRIEIVEAADVGEPQRPPFRGIRVHPIEVFEITTKFSMTYARYGVLAHCLGLARNGGHNGNQGHQPQGNQQLSTGNSHVARNIEPG